MSAAARTLQSAVTLLSPDGSGNRRERRWPLRLRVTRHVTRRSKWRNAEKG